MPIKRRLHFKFWAQIYKPEGVLFMLTCMSCILNKEYIVA